MLHYAAFHLGLHCLVKKIHLGVTSVQRFKHRRIRLDILVELTAKPCFLKTSRKISNILSYTAVLNGALKVNLSYKNTF